MPIWKQVGCNLLIVFVLTIIFVVSAYLLHGNLPSPIQRELLFLRGFPWSLSIVISIGMVSLSAVAGRSEQLRNWTTKTAVPSPIRLILSILLAAKPESLLPWAWWSLFIATLVSLGLLWHYPRCIGNNDILVSFKITNEAEDIAILSSGEIVTIAPGIIVRLNVEVVSTLPEGLPTMKYQWWEAGDGVLLQTAGPMVDYQSGRDEYRDEVYLQLTQRGCSPLKFYSFSIERNKP